MKFKTTLGLAVAGLAVFFFTSLSHAAEKLLSRSSAIVERTGKIEDDFQAVVSKRKLSNKFSELSGVFSTSPTGKALAAVATLHQTGLRSDNQADNTLLLDYLAELAKDPAQTLSEVTQAFSKLPDSYAPERQFLIQAVARMPLPQSQVAGFLGGELKRPVPAPSADGQYDAAFFTPAIALDSLIQVTHNTAMVESYLGPVLGSSGVTNDEKSLLLSRYYAFYPAKAEKLGVEYGVQK